MAEFTPDSESMPIGSRCKFFFKFHWRGVVFFLIVSLFLPVLALEPVKVFRCVYLVLIMFFLYITEAIPLYLTGTLPIILLPPMGIVESAKTCVSYYHDELMVFFGSLIIGIALEFSKLNRRMALYFMMIYGTRPRIIHLVLVIMAWLFSFFLPTALVCSVLCSMLKAILQEMEAQNIYKLTKDKEPDLPDDPPYPSNIVVCYYLGVAYGCALGGVGSTLGSDMNTVFIQDFEKQFPDAKNVLTPDRLVGFSLPLSFVLVPIVYLWLQILYMGLFRPNSAEGVELAASDAAQGESRGVLREKRAEMGMLSCHEVQVLFLFLLMIGLCLSRKPNFTEGWADFLNEKIILASFAIMFVVFAFFFLPQNYNFLKYCICRRPEKEVTAPSLLSWKILNQLMPWGLLFVVGATFALCLGIQNSGLPEQIDEWVHGLKSLPGPMVQLTCIFLAMLASSITASSSISKIITPILFKLAVKANLNPLYLAIPSILALNMAFHLPASSYPNAVVHGFGRIRTKDMIIAGFGPTVFALLLNFLFCQVLGEAFYPDFNKFPDWATA